MTNNLALERAVSRRMRHLHGGGAKVLSMTETGDAVLVEVPAKYRNVDPPQNVAHSISVSKDGRLTFGSAQTVSIDDMLTLDSKEASGPRPNTALADLLDNEPDGLAFIEAVDSVMSERGWDAQDVDLRRDAIRLVEQRRPDLQEVGDVVKSLACTALNIENDFDIAVFLAAQRHGLDLSDPGQHEEAAVLALSESNADTPLYGPDAELAKQAGGIPQLRAMQRIARDEGLKMSRDWLLIRKHLYERYPEWCPTSVRDALNLDEACEHLLFTEKDFCWSNDHDRMRAYERAISLRPQLLTDAYSLSDAQRAMIGEPPKEPQRVDLAEQQRRQGEQANADKLRAMAEDLVLRRGGNLSDYLTMSAAMEEILAENPALVPPGYGVSV